MPMVFEKTRGLTDRETHYCPGCTHGIIHRLVAEVLEEMELLDATIGVAPVGCSVLAYDYFNCDMHEAAHGRAPAVAATASPMLPGFGRANASRATSSRAAATSASARRSASRRSASRRS